MGGVGVVLRRSLGRGWRGWRVACGVACTALLALWLTRGGVASAGARAELSSRRAFPRRAPADIAHRLADFSTLPHASSATPGSWRVEEERGNLSSWRYRVEWACGAQCSGEAHVAAEAAAPGAPSHAPARRHRVTLRVRTCTTALLPWRAACDEIEVAAEVEPDGTDGTVLRERARATCGAGAARDDACAATLRAHRARHHATLEGAV